MLAPAARICRHAGVSPQSKVAPVVCISGDQPMIPVLAEVGQLPFWQGHCHAARVQPHAQQFYASSGRHILLPRQRHTHVSANVFDPAMRSVGFPGMCGTYPIEIV